MILYHRQYLTSQIWLFATCPWCLKSNLSGYLKKYVWDDPKLELSEHFEKNFASVLLSVTQPKEEWTATALLQVKGSSGGFFLGEDQYASSVNLEIWQFKLKKWKPFSYVYFVSSFSVARWHFLRKTSKPFNNNFLKHFWMYKEEYLRFHI